MDNQELDKLFRETIRDFRETPDPGVWTRVRATLDREKKARRLVPFWYRLGAAAALLLGAIFLFAPRNTADPSSSPVDTETPVVSSPADGEDPPVARKSPMPSGPESRPAAEQETQPRAGERLLVGQQEQDPPPTAPREVLKKESPTQPESLVASSEISPAAFAGKGQEGELGAPAAGATLALGVAERENPAGAATLPQTRERDEPPGSSLAESGEEKPSVFEVPEQNEDPVKKKPEGPRWSVGPSVAPVYFSSFGDGSPISSSFVANDKSGSFNMSYGLQVSYGVSKKLSFRTGIHRVDYGYNTEEIGFTASPVGSGNSLIRTINYSENSRDLVVKSMVNGSRQPDDKAALDVTAPSPVREGRMVQEFGYLEIPLEMQYSLIDKTWGVNLIGGMSSLFLVNNSVSLESSGAITEVGEATNMNSVNFSTNFGVGLYYRLGQNMELNLLPMFKYQLNTFSNTSGNFRPYSVGVYSGLNFRF